MIRPAGSARATGHVDEMYLFPSPGGEPLWIAPKDLAIFFLERGRPNKVLNRRLPRITARDLLSHRVARGFFLRSTHRYIIKRRNVRGSHLFKEICGQAPGRGKHRGFFGHDPKRLPSRRWVITRRIRKPHLSSTTSMHSTSSQHSVPPSLRLFRSYRIGIA